MGLGAIGAAIGEGYTAAQANLAVSRNPDASGELFKNMLVGQAVAESASIFALVIAILLLFLDPGSAGQKLDMAAVPGPAQGKSPFRSAQGRRCIDKRSIL